MMELNYILTNREILSKNAKTYTMKIILLVLIFIISPKLQAQSTSEGNWFTDATEAQAFASSNNSSNILMVFAGGDWCRPCIKFKKDVLLNDHFSEKTKTSLVTLYLDFPAKKKNRLSKEATLHNEELAEKHNSSGSFPKIILFDYEMNKLKEIKYEGQDVSTFLQLLN